MSLLDDLHSLDLSGIVQARGSISGSIQSPQLQAILQGGAAQAALGSLGSSLGSLRGSVQDPSALLKPVLDAVGGLLGHVKTDQLPLPKLLEAVGEGVSIVVQLVEGLDQDPAAITKLLGFDLQKSFDSVAPVIGSYTNVGGELGKFRALVDRLESGVPTDPRAYADFAMDALLPFPRVALQEIRTGLDAMLESSVQIALPSGRNAGLLAALDAVAAAGASGNAAALQVALADVTRARTNTLQVIHDDVMFVFDQVGRLHIDQVLGPIARASSALSKTEDGVLEFLGRWRADFDHARTLIENMDPAQIRSYFNMMMQLLEEQAQLRIVAPIDEQVRRLEDFVRGLLSHLPLRSLRTQLNEFLHSIAQTIHDAGIDAIAKSIHDMLGKIQSALNPTKLTADVQAAISTAKQVITQALQPIVSALQQIGAQVQAVADQAKQVLERAVGAIGAFSDAMNQVKAAVDGLGVEAASQQIIDTLHKLRETAEQLLSAAPLPEPLRPVVEQLISTLEGLDFDVVFQPVKEAVAQIQVPPEVTVKITEGLRAVKDILDHLIPAELIASIEAEVKDALDEIRNFDPAKLLEGVTKYLNEAAQFIEGLDPTATVDQIRGPFQAVLDAVDAAQPRKLLKPVIDAYDSVLSHVQIPGPEVAIQGLTTLFNSIGEKVAGAALSPVSQVSGGQASAPSAAPSSGAGGSSPQPSGGSTPAGGSAPAATGPQPGNATDPPQGGVRPGDIIRLFGYVPKKLQAALAAVEAGPAGEAIQAIDKLTGGMARDLRRLQSAVQQIEVRLDQALSQELLPLGAAQVRAQLSIRAGFGNGSVQVSASLEALAALSPDAMQQALSDSLGAVRQRTRGLAHAAAGSLEASIERTATALESCQLARMATSLDAFLAALDPEPLALELDEVVFAILKKAPALMTEIQDDIIHLGQKLQELIRELNPGTQAQKFLHVLDVLREEFDVLNPARLADELGEIHAVIRNMIAAYDPAVFAAKINAVLQEIAQSLQSLNPSQLLGDLSFLNGIVDQIQQAVPTKALAGVGAGLADVGNKLVAADPAGLLASIEQLGPQIVDAFEKAIDAIRKEAVALLESIKYASANASASVSGSASLGVA